MYHPKDTGIVFLQTLYPISSVSFKRQWIEKSVADHFSSETDRQIIRNMGSLHQPVDKFLDYIFVDFWEQNSHPRTKGLLKSPFPILLVVGLYLNFVFDMGPKWMRDRKPYDLKHILKWYNWINIVWNAIFFVTTIYTTNFTKDCWTCSDTPYPTLFIIGGLSYTALKVFDLCDTVFFILRKKMNQVTPLHVAHHSIMPMTSWLAFKYAPIPSAALVVALNSAVHTVMYYYYQLASERKDIWWKNYITLMQLVQFYIALTHALVQLYIPGCIYPKWIASLQIAESVFFIITFTRFYVRTFTKKKSAVE